jgi:uncharacterized Zn finger protein
VLESFDIGARLARGRGYARKGQVLDLVIDSGTVSARVQGSRRVPYKIVIALKPIAARNWKRLGKAVAADAWSAARLVAGEMPETLEDTFKTLGVPLLPAKRNDLTTSCSCPDWSNPCKHVAAVYYLLGEVFDRDPFLLFRLRGLSREGFVAHLAEAQPRLVAKHPWPRRLRHNLCPLILRHSGAASPSTACLARKAGIPTPCRWLPRLDPCRCGVARRISLAR